MPAATSLIRRRSTVLCLAAFVALATLSAGARRWSGSTIILGRVWARSDRIAHADISHALWDDLLQRFVDADGNIDYWGWKHSAQDLAKLDEYLEALSRLDEGRAADTPERLAFWINAYNALTVRGILREYPTNSIRNHAAYFWGYNIWRDLRLKVGDASYSLGEIEHTILRPLAEPRIHFAIVCASRGCPRLLNEAYTAERLEGQLERNARHFFADLNKCAVGARSNELRLSPILRWYAADFVSPTKSTLQRIAAWLPDDAKAVAERQDAVVVYFDYDWSLNEQTNSAPPMPPPE